MLQVKKGMEDEYEEAFRRASEIISSMKGYISHELQSCMKVKATTSFLRPISNS